MAKPKTHEAYWVVKIMSKSLDSSVEGTCLSCLASLSISSRPVTSSRSRLSWSIRPNRSLSLSWHNSQHSIRIINQEGQKRCFKGTWLWSGFSGVLHKRFGIGPLNYVSSRSDFGFELAEILLIEKRRPDSPSRQDCLKIQFFANL